MPKAVKRPYHSAIRAENARRTRERILEAARERFLEAGYAGASLASIASAANVAPETVYDVFGTKRSLLEQLISTTIAGGVDDALGSMSMAWVGALQEMPDLAARIAGFAEHTAQTLERTGPIHALIGDAAGADPEIVELQSRLHAGRFRRQRAILKSLSRGDKRMFDSNASDTFSALTAPDLHHHLRTVRGWTAERYVAWLRVTIVAALMGGSQSVIRPRSPD